MKAENLATPKAGRGRGRGRARGVLGRGQKHTAEAEEQQEEPEEEEEQEEQQEQQKRKKVRAKRNENLMESENTAATRTKQALMDAASIRAEKRAAKAAGSLGMLMSNKLPGMVIPDSLQEDGRQCLAWMHMCCSLTSHMMYVMLRLDS